MLTVCKGPTSFEDLRTVGNVALMDTVLLQWCIYQPSLVGICFLLMVEKKKEPCRLFIGRVYRNHLLSILSINKWEVSVLINVSFHVLL